MAESFSIKKFFASFFQAVPWAKNIRFILGLVIVLFIAFTIWRAYIMPRNKQTQSTQIRVMPGATLNLEDNRQQKIEEKKRPWWLPHLFVEAYGLQEFYSGGTTRQGVGGRVGGRLEW